MRIGASAEGACDTTFGDRAYAASVSPGGRSVRSIGAARSWRTGRAAGRPGRRSSSAPRTPRRRRSPRTPLPGRKPWSTATCGRRARRPSPRSRGCGTRRVSPARQRRGRPEADVDVQRRGVERVQVPGRAAGSRCRSGHIHTGSMPVRSSRKRDELGEPVDRDLDVLDDLLALPACRGGRRSGASRRTCARARSASSRRRSGASASARAGGSAGSARRTPGSTRTSRCPSARGSRGWSASPRRAAGSSGSRSAGRCSRDARRRASSRSVASVR